MTASPPDGVYTLLEHTADLRLRLEAPTPAAVYRLAVRAVGEILRGAAPRGVRREETVAVALEGSDPAELLVALCNEVLFHLETRAALATSLRCHTVEAHRLTGRLHLEAVAPEDELLQPKAATYSELCWDVGDAGIVAEITLDL